MTSEANRLSLFHLGTVCAGKRHYEIWRTTTSGCFPTWRPSEYRGMLERYFESMGAFFPVDKSAKRFIGTSFSYSSVFCFQISYRSSTFYTRFWIL